MILEVIGSELPSKHLRTLRLRNTKGVAQGHTAANEKAPILGHVLWILASFFLLHFLFYVLPSPSETDAQRFS